MKKHDRQEERMHRVMRFSVARRREESSGFIRIVRITKINWKSDINSNNNNKLPKDWNQQEYSARRSPAACRENSSERAGRWPNLRENLGKG